MTAQTLPALQSIRQQVEDLLKVQDVDALTALLMEEHPADIADVLELLDEDDRITIFNLLQPLVAAEVLDETRTEVTRELVEALPNEQVADLLEAMPADDAAEVLSELSDEQAEQILQLMGPEEAADVETLLAYPEDTAGRLMTTNIVRLDAAWTAEETLAHLRTVDEETEVLTYLYVVNGGGRLAGIVPLHKLMTAPLQKRIADIMTTGMISVNVYADQEEVARVVSQYDFFAIPVIDNDERLLGIVTHDDVIDILHDEFTEDVQRFGGSQPLEHTYLSTSILVMVRKRIGWLLLLFVTATLTGTVIRLFEDVLSATVALSFFIPLLIGTGGNAGYQMTATMIRALAMREVSLGDVWHVLGREIVTGLILGLLMGLAGLARALTWEPSIRLGLTVAAALCALVLWANVMGMLLPFLAARLRIDPAVVSGPVMSTLVDATGLIIYFKLAQVILGV